MKRAWHQKFKRAAKERRTDRDGTVFSTIGELARWHKLQLWQVAGQIRNLRRQVKYPLQRLDNGDDIVVKTDTGKVMIYTADFVYEKPMRDPTPMPMPIKHGDNCPWTEVIEDYKGYRGPVEKLRIAVFEALYKVKVHIVR